MAKSKKKSKNKYKFVTAPARRFPRFPPADAISKSLRMLIYSQQQESAELKAKLKAKEAENAELKAKLKVKEAKEDLMKLTKTELQDKCKELGITYKKAWKKDKLVHCIADSSAVIMDATALEVQVGDNWAFNIAAEVLVKKDEARKRRIASDGWKDSIFGCIKNFGPDDTGTSGEDIIQQLNQACNIKSDIDGKKTKGENAGDGTIYGKSCEIKACRLANRHFQHELGLTPWMTEFMIFVDIASDKFYVTIFKNFTQEFYKESGKSKRGNAAVKCAPAFPTKKITWRGGKGAFKLDTSPANNERSKFTFTFGPESTKAQFKTFVDSIINPEE